MNGRQARVHVIIPVYNPPEKFFRECLRSMAAQTHENFSCVLVDDGSAAGTAAICDEMAAADPRFRVVHKTNGGTAYARRDGVLAAIADGAEYIAFVDSDDSVEPGYLAVMLEKLLETETDACFCAFNIVSGDTVTTNGWAPSEPGVSADRCGLLLSVFGFPHGNFGSRMVVWAGIYRASLFNGIDWDFNRIKIGEDTRLSWQLMLNSRNAAFVADRLYNYVQNNSGAMQSADYAKKQEFTYESWVAMIGHAKRAGIEKGFADCRAECEAHVFYNLLERMIGAGADGRFLRNETDECVRRIRGAMKSPGALSRFSRRKRMGLRILGFAGFKAYRFCRSLYKTAK